MSYPVLLDMSLSRPATPPCRSDDVDTLSASNELIRLLILACNDSVVLREIVDNNPDASVIASKFARLVEGAQFAKKETERKRQNKVMTQGDPSPRNHGVEPPFSSGRDVGYRVARV